jgi:hypothetical protein
MCKLRYETQKDFLDAAREFRKRGLPANATGRIGLINAADTIGTLKAWN